MLSWNFAGAAGRSSSDANLSTCIHGLINYTDTKAKCRHLKKMNCKGALRQVFTFLRLPPERRREEICFLPSINSDNTCREVPLQVNFLDDDILHCLL
jgi:hypothetical protein